MNTVYMAGPKLSAKHKVPLWLDDREINFRPRRYVKSADTVSITTWIKAMITGFLLKMKRTAAIKKG